MPPERWINPILLQNKFVPSADFLRTADSMQAVRYYYSATRNMALQVAALFKAAFPAYYVKYKDAFEAGVWKAEDPGAFLGRAIVWKLPVLPHWDGLDAGPAVIFPVGNFSGGELYLPDLKLKLMCVFHILNTAYYCSDRKQI